MLPICCRRVLTAAWLSVMFGLVFWNMPTGTLDAVRNRVTLLFGTLQLCFLLPFMSLSVYTGRPHADQHLQPL